MHIHRLHTEAGANLDPMGPPTERQLRFYQAGQKGWQLLAELGEFLKGGGQQHHHGGMYLPLVRTPHDD